MVIIMIIFMVSVSLLSLTVSANQGVGGSPQEWRGVGRGKMGKHLLNAVRLRHSRDLLSTYHYPTTKYDIP